MYRDGSGTTTLSYRPMMLSNLAANVTTPQLALVSSSAILLVYGIYKISTFIYHEITSPVRDIPGPPSPSFIYGNFKQLLESGIVFQEDWFNRYGTTIQFKWILGETCLMTTDLKANNHLLFNCYDYPKTPAITYMVRQLLGDGIVIAEGNSHKHQRKILNPAFGPQQIRELTEIFVEKALELRDVWSAEIVKHDGVGPIECLSWMSRITLDIIGLAGFNYKFNALTCDPAKNELMKSFSKILQAGQTSTVIPTLRATYPALRFKFLSAPIDIEREKAKAVMSRIGTDLLNQTKDDYKGDKSSSRKDILSLLVRANDLPEGQRLRDENVMGQIPTFLVAGHETTAITVTWALYSLTQNKQVQTKLRQELSKLSTDNPTMDDLNGLPYLDAVVRETLRLYPAVHNLFRAAAKDDCIPLSKPFTDRKGIVKNEIRIRKGQSIVIPVAIINRDKSIWGEDSAEFNPERWENIPDGATSIPGAWANLMTFSGGPRACIAFRFALIEIKAILYTLVRAFEIDLGVSAKDIGARTADLGRPILLTEPSNANQMPLLVRPVASNL